MQTIFVMVKCRLGMAYEVAAAAVDEVDHVSEVYSISGQHDLMMKCTLNDDMDIGHFVTSELQLIDGITDTFTLITFNAFT